MFFLNVAKIFHLSFLKFLLSAHYTTNFDFIWKKVRIIQLVLKAWLLLCHLCETKKKKNLTFSVTQS